MIRLRNFLLLAGVLGALALGSLFMAQSLGAQQGYPLPPVVASALTKIGLEQLPDCSGFGPGKYTYIEVVGAAGTKPQKVCVSLGNSIQLVGTNPPLVVVPPPSSTAISFSYGEVPGGAMDGTNAVFTVAQAPQPAASLNLYRNGIALSPGVDYTFSGVTITFVSAPHPGDILFCWYRIS